MNDITPQAATIVDRLAHLEARLHRLRSGLIAAWVLVVALLLRVVWPSPAPQVVVDDDRLVVKDDDGQVRATFGMHTPSAAGLTLFDARGRALVRITTEEQAGRVLLANAEDPVNNEDRVTLSAQGRTRLVLRGATAEGWRLEAGGSTNLTMRYPGGETAFMAAATTPGSFYTSPPTPLSSP